MKILLERLRVVLSRARSMGISLWQRYRGLPRRSQIAIGIVVALILIGLVVLISQSKPLEDAQTARTVTLRSVAELSGGTSGGTVIGSVRSRSEAALLAESSGTVKSVRTRLGAVVPAGFVLAELDNATEAAALLQAQGSYEAALAGRAAASSEDAATSARNTYRQAYNTLDAIFKTDFSVGYFPDKRNAIVTALDAWKEHLRTADTVDPLVLLNEAQTVTQMVSQNITDITAQAKRDQYNPTGAQAATLAAARSGVDALVNTLSLARDTYRAKSVSSTQGADASVKIALGVLRLAQANYEKTLIRTPIGGQVNFLPIRVGDYVKNFQQVATVAQNGALEVVSYVSEETRAGLTEGAAVRINDAPIGIITSIAPALDPVTKQIELTIAVTGATNTSLVNGQSVRIGLPREERTTTVKNEPVMLPLTAVKLTASNRSVFTVGENKKLVAIPVTIGEVRGERIEITSPLPVDTKVVIDARGLSDGQEVRVEE